MTYSAEDLFCYLAVFRPDLVVLNDRVVVGDLEALILFESVFAHRRHDRHGEDGKGQELRTTETHSLTHETVFFSLLRLIQHCVRACVNVLD